MFSARLKASPLWRAAVPLLASPDGLNLREFQIESHDIAFPYHSSGTTRNGSGTDTLRILLLSQEDHAGVHRDMILEKLRRFECLTGGVDLAIVFLLRDTSSTSANAVFDYLQLQALVASDPNLRAIPVFPIDEPSSLATVVQKHARALAQGPSVASSTAMKTSLLRPLDLLPHCTSTAPLVPLDQHTVFLLTDMVRTIADLARASVPQTSSDRRVRVRIQEGLKEQVANAENVAETLWEFWREEWICD